MVRPVRFALLAEEGTELLVNFYLNHRFQTLAYQRSHCRPISPELRSLLWLKLEPFWEEKFQ